MPTQVLLVDEDADVLDITATFLERNGDLAVSTEADPETALERVTDGGFDAVVTDLTMPEMDGLELCAGIRDAGIDMPVLLFTGREPGEIEDLEGSSCLTAIVRKGTGTDQYEDLADHIASNV